MLLTARDVCSQSSLRAVSPRQFNRVLWEELCPLIQDQCRGRDAYLLCLDNAPRHVRFACISATVKNCEESLASGFSLTTSSYEFKMIATGRRVTMGGLSVVPRHAKRTYDYTTLNLVRWRWNICILEGASSDKEGHTYQRC